MRATFVDVATNLLAANPKVCLLLGDISVFAFADAFKRFPDRCWNFGINEGAMVGAAAGLAAEGMTPIVHTIAPFLVGRAFEQIMVDFGYQKKAGVFVSVGASYDYSTLGPTHGAPYDVALMMQVPNMRVIVPARKPDVDFWLCDAVLETAKSTYIRLAETSDEQVFVAETWNDDDVLVIAVGPTYSVCRAAVAATREPERFHVVNPTKVKPWPRIPFLERHAKQVLLVEPFNEGTLTHAVMEASQGGLEIMHAGVHMTAPTRYGSRKDHDKLHGLTVESIKLKLESFL